MLEIAAYGLREQFSFKTWVGDLKKHCIIPRASASGLLEVTVRVTMKWDLEESMCTRVGLWDLSFNTELISCITSAELRTDLTHKHMQTCDSHMRTELKVQWKSRSNKPKNADMYTLVQNTCINTPTKIVWHKREQCLKQNILIYLKQNTVDFIDQ